MSVAKSSELITYRRHDDDNYDCVIPVSGGKDSTYSYTYTSRGMNPLCVVAQLILYRH